MKTCLLSASDKNKVYSDIILSVCLLYYYILSEKNIFHLLFLFVKFCLLWVAIFTTYVFFWDMIDKLIVKHGVG